MLFELIKKMATWFSVAFTAVTVGAYFLDWFLLKFTDDRDK